MNRMSKLHTLRFQNADFFDKHDRPSDDLRPATAAMAV